MAQITLYSNQNNELIKFPLPVQEMSWFQNAPGRLVFDVPKDHPCAKWRFLKWGIRVTAELEGFPTWVGFIDPPRLSGNGKIRVNCRSMEYLLHYRRVRTATQGGFVSDPILIRGTAGDLAYQILELANNAYVTGISVGGITYAGSQRQETLNDMLDVHLTNIAKRTGYQWSVTGSNEDGLLKLKLNFVPKEGVRTDVVLEEGMDFETTSYDNFFVEDGFVYNDVLGIGEAEIDSSVPAFISKDDYWINQYDLRQTLVTFLGAKAYSTVQNDSQQYLRSHLQTANNVNPSIPYTEDTASKLRIGYYVNLVFHSVGLNMDDTTGVEGLFPVIGITYTDTSRKISLIVNTTELL